MSKLQPGNSSIIHIEIPEMSFKTDEKLEKVGRSFLNIMLTFTNNNPSLILHIHGLEYTQYTNKDVAMILPTKYSLIVTKDQEY